VAPPWRHDRSFEKAAKNRGRLFLGFGRRARGLRGRPTYRLTFNSPPLTLYSPALRVSAGKSGVGEGECQVSWMQISVSFWCQVQNHFLASPIPRGKLWLLSTFESAISRPVEPRLGRRCETMPPTLRWQPRSLSRVLITRMNKWPSCSSKPKRISNARPIRKLTA
jgi:hypothetical protein